MNFNVPLAWEGDGLGDGAFDETKLIPICVIAVFFFNGTGFNSCCFLKDFLSNLIKSDVALETT